VAIKSLAAGIIELQKKYIRDSTGILIPNQIAALYFRMGNKEVAEKYAEKVLKTDSRNKDALLLLSTIRKG
jgi:Tfp pilus assembly protein PilF